MSVSTDRVENLLQRWALRGLMVDVKGKHELLKLVRDVEHARVAVAELVEALINQIRQMDDISGAWDRAPFHALVLRFLENADVPPPVCTGTGQQATPHNGGWMCGVCEKSGLAVPSGNPEQALVQAIRHLIKATRLLHADRLTTEEEAAAKEAFRNA